MAEDAPNSLADLALLTKSDPEEPNQSLDLASGPCKVRIGADWLTGDAHIRAEWTPRRAMTCTVHFSDIQFATAHRYSPERGDTPLIFENKELKARYRRAREGANGQFVLDFELYEPDDEFRNIDVPVVEVTFDIVNLRRHYGNDVDLSSGDDDLPGGSTSGRLLLSADGWDIVIDAYDIHTASSDESTHNGYVVTHRGLAKRRYGDPVSASRAQTLISTMQYWTSILESRWVSPIRVVARSDNGEIVWRELWMRHIARERPARRWAAAWVPGIAEALFHLVAAKFASDEQLLKHVAFYYVDAADSTSVNSSVIMTHAFLEVVGWQIVVNDLGLLSGAAYDRLKAEDRLGMLLAILKTDRKVPTQLPLLHGLIRTNQSWGDDGALVTTEMRNAAIHAKREVHRKNWGRAWLECMSLCERYADLALLYWLGYAGTYLDCATAKTASDLTPVPWNAQTETEVEPE